MCPPEWFFQGPKIEWKRLVQLRPTSGRHKKCLMELWNVFRLRLATFPRGKKDDGGRFRLAIEMDAGEKRANRGRKGAGMSVFGTTLPPSIGACRGGADAAERPEPTVATGSTHPKKKAPNRSLVAHIITYMSHTTAIDRIFNAWLFRDHAHKCVQFDRRPESAAIVSFATRTF